MPAEAVTAWQRFRAAGGGGSLIVAILFFLCMLLLDTWPSDPLPYRRGEYLPQDIHARVDFDIAPQRLLDKAIDNVANTTPPTFKLNAAAISKIVSDLTALPGKLSPATQPSDVDPNLRREFALSAPESIQAWKAVTQPARSPGYPEQLQGLRLALQQTPLVLASDLDNASPDVYLITPSGRETIRARRLISLDRSTDVEETVAHLVREVDPSIRESVRSYLVNTFMVARPRIPLYEIDKAATRRDVDARIAAIQADPPKEHFKEGERLVRRSLRDLAGGKAVGLDADDLLLLAAEHEAFVAREKSEHPWLRLGRATGRAAIGLLITAMICFYVVRLQTQVIRNYWRGAQLGVLLLLMMALAKAMYFPLQCNIHAMVLPILLGAIILTVAYDQRFAFVMGAMLSVLMVFQLQADFALFLVLLAALMAVVFQLREIRRRSRLIEVNAVAAVVIFLTVCAVGLAASVPWRFILSDGLWAAGFAVLVGFLAQGILPLIERLVGVATSLTLLEWCDASKPLLKRLAMDAPGTYNHSLQLGTMCEAAADAIGARGLLARVGAYYHDIGKINKAEYFVENQCSIASKHAKLSPAMSLLIIIGHVKDGIELARRYKLPRVLHEFITSHHGTTLLQYFYQSATEKHRPRLERAPDEVEFRYPGPKPRSKECAILMLADAAESSVRSMSEPTPGRIENQVHTMVNRRLMDGQLDDCDLTLKEVHLIEQSLIKSLCGIYHSRPSYPTPAGKRASAAELLAARVQAEKQAARNPAAAQPTAPPEPAPAAPAPTTPMPPDSSPTNPDAPATPSAEKA
jgi:hypothetical protein